MKSKKDLTRAERLEIEILLTKDYSQRSIAKALDRSPNTISYEIRENSTEGVYDALKADAKARLRKRMRRLQWSKIEENPEIKNGVIEKLKEGWNPDEIAGFLKRTKDSRYVSKTAIYDWLRTSRGERYCLYLYSKRKRVKKRGAASQRVMIPKRVGIERRSVSITNRTRYGHWERDSIVSKREGTGGLATHQERKSRLLVATKVTTMSPSEHSAVTQAVHARHIMKSTTTDNGIENREHEAWGMPTYFCDPYSSWQKGGIENANKMLRAFFPKGTDFAGITQEAVDAACRSINNKPRRILGYRSALEIARKAGIIKNTSVLIQG